MLIVLTTDTDRQIKRILGKTPKNFYYLCRSLPKEVCPKMQTDLFLNSKNPCQSEKRNNGVLDRLCQKKYYFQKAKKLFKKLLAK